MYILLLLVATSCGLMSLGALIIENSINCLQSNKINEHVAKKKKYMLPCLEDTWIKLAEYVFTFFFFFLLFHLKKFNFYYFKDLQTYR